MRFTRDQAAAVSVMAFAGMLVMYIETMIVPSIPKLVQYFNTDYDSISWVVTSYLISGTVSSIIFGKLADLYGKKRMFLIVSGIYSISVIFGGFATDLAEFIVIRTFQGMGMAMFPIAFSLIRDEFPPDEIPLAQGVVSATFAGGASLGLVVGAYISQNYGWEWDYHTAIPITVLLFILALKFLKESNIRLNARLDIPGTILLSGGIIMALIATSQGQYWGWYSQSIISLYAFSIVLLSLFILVEDYVKQPLMDLRLLSSRNILLLNIVSLLAASGMFFLYFTIPPLLEDPPPAGFGESIITAGLTNLPAAIFAMIFAPVAALATRKRGPRFSIFVGVIVQIISFLALYFNRSDVFSITEDSLLLGVGNSFTMVGIINMLVAVTPQEKMGISTGMNQLFRNVGSVIAPAIAGVIETGYQQAVLMGVLPIKFSSLSMIPLFGFYPSQQAFDLIYITGITVAFITLFLVSLLKKVNIGGV
ncbi:MAG: MFS transporter [Thermoplasmata archaeon]|nr:MFS transporter [Thermoplasmatales archaeon]